MNSEFVFSTGHLKAALLDLLETRSLGNRSGYVGASEVGICMRLTTWKKLNPALASSFEPSVAAILELGHVIEDVNVRRINAILARTGMGNLDHTGQEQLFIQDPESPLACHPDGIFKMKTGMPEGGWVTDFSGRAMVFSHLTFPATSEGQGVLELKSTNAEKLKKWQRVGLPIYYVDQTQVNMGLSGSSWGFLLATNRTDLTDNAGFMIPFKKERFELMRSRAVEIMEHVEKQELPKGEAIRAPWANGCSQCPIYKDCPQRGQR